MKFPGTEKTAFRRDYFTFITILHLAKNVVI